MKAVVFLSLLFFCSYKNNALQAQSSELEAEIDEAIQKAIIWFAKDKDNFNPSTFVLYHQLERKFGAAPIANHDAYIQRIETEESWYKSMYSLIRFVSADKQIDPTFVLTTKSRSTRLLGIAIWADVMDLPENYLDEVAALSAKKRSKAIYVHIILQLLKQHQHSICNNERFSALEKTNLQLLRDQIRDFHPAHDRSLEALAFMHISGHGKEFLTKERIETILKHQEPSGAWKFDTTEDQSEQHTTLFAIWLLYEYRYPNAKLVPWIKFPSQSNPKK